MIPCYVSGIHAVVHGRNGDYPTGSPTSVTISGNLISFVLPLLHPEADTLVSNTIYLGPSHVTLPITPPMKVSGGNVSVVQSISWDALEAAHPVPEG
jgi:hypothetical protein